MINIKNLCATLLLCTTSSMGVNAAYNVHVFRNDGKYNVYDKEKIDTIRVRDSVEFEFKNGARYAVEKNSVDSIMFMDTCLIAEINIVTEDSAAISSKTEYVNCTFYINGHNIFESDTLTGKIRGRGNSTWEWYDKKPYRIKLDSKSKMLGLKKAKDWVLLANYRDPTFLMNAYALEMADYMNLPFTNHSRFCELSINGEFVGLYMLTEQIKQGNNRVEINKDNGILLSLDVDDGPDNSPDADDNFWGTITEASSSSQEEQSPFGGRGGMGGMGGWGQQSSTTKIPVCIKYPEDSVMTARKTDIENEFARLTTVIGNHDYATFKTIMDVQSYIDFIILQEMTYNVELEAPRSMYLHRYNDKDTLWHMGPAWDFDGGFSFDWTDMTTSRKYFTSNKSLIGADPTENPNGVNPFFILMFNDDDFKQDFKARWNQIKDNLLPMLFTKIENYKLQIECSMDKDKEKWNLNTDFDTQFENLENWLTKQYELMDKNFNNF